MAECKKWNDLNLIPVTHCLCGFCVKDTHFPGSSKGCHGCENPGTCFQSMVLRGWAIGCGSFPVPLVYPCAEKGGIVDHVDIWGHPAEVLIWLHQQDTMCRWFALLPMSTMQITLTSRSE